MNHQVNMPDRKTTAARPGLWLAMHGLCLVLLGNCNFNPFSLIPQSPGPSDPSLPPTSTPPAGGGGNGGATPPPPIPTSPGGPAENCAECHNVASFANHAVRGTWQPTCAECHAAHDSTSNLFFVVGSVQNRTLGGALSVSYTARTGPGSFSDGIAPNNGICQVCHTSTSHHRFDGSGSLHHEGADCTTCHSHGRGFIPVDGGSCIGCHSTPLGSRAKIVNADGSGGHHLANATMSDSDCVTCHDASRHRQGIVRLWSSPGSTAAAFDVTGDQSQLTSFCAACHDSATHPAIHQTNASWKPACTECHAVHDTDNSNLRLVRASVLNKTLNLNLPVTFGARTGPGSFSDGFGANNGICQVCHTVTSHHRYDGSGSSHNEGADCTLCHSHPDGFSPSATQSCLGCHNSPQGQRRAVVGEFGLASHHVGGAGVNDVDCQVCHDMSTHQGGQVRLKNVDTPDNAAASVVLTGNPMTSAVEARKLAPFCLACHDADAAAGHAPFSDGLMPTIVDASQWTLSSHAASQTTCVGDGETFGCHSTGHGSAKRKLQAPWNGGQTAIAGDPLRQEEGMCYSCHRDGGVASSDLQSQFALSSHHNVSAVDQTDGSRLECVNCHNPHTATHAVKLTNPDSGVPWTGSGEAFCLACHDGSAPAGVVFPPTANGTGFNKSSFVGTTHDAATGTNSCYHCHLPHGAAQRSLLRRKYVVADYNQSTPGDGDYALCWQCHTESAVIQSSNAFGTRHSLHVQSKRAPCIICHDAHRGFDANEPGLIDFNGPVQSNGYNIQFLNGQSGSTAFSLNANLTQGSCSITCHGEDHTPETYARTNVSTTNCGACH